MHAKYEVSTSNGSKVIPKVKVDNRQTDRQTDKQTDRQTDRKKQYAPDHSIRGHKNLSPYTCSCPIIINSKPKSISFCQFKATSILKVLLTQYKSLTGPNKFSRGITPTNADQRGPKRQLDMKFSENLAKGNNSREGMLNATKVKLDL